MPGWAPVVRIDAASEDVRLKRREDTPVDEDEGLTVPPHDVMAEQSLLGSMLMSKHSVDGAARIVRSEDFYRPSHTSIYSTILQLTLDSEPADAITVANHLQREGELQRIGGAPYLHELVSTVSTTANSDYYARIVKDMADRRRVIGTFQRGLQSIRTLEASEVLARSMSEFQLIEAGIDPALETYDFAELLTTQEDDRPWVIPGMLRVNERCIWTGPEGGGKSVLISQLALGAAMGVNTLDPMWGTHEPMRVLMLDVENDRLQVKSNMLKVYPHLQEITGGVKPQIEWINVQDIDLSDPVERQRVMRIAQERQPQLMYLGSLYKLAPEGEKSDAQFMHVSRTIDRIRAETGTAILLEAHTGHGTQNDRNGTMRPYGSSMWLRWPEFGLAMMPQKGRTIAQVGTWRGHRSDDRLWPYGLKRGSVMPWVAMEEAEWEYEMGRGK